MVFSVWILVRDQARTIVLKFIAFWRNPSRLFTHVPAIVLLLALHFLHAYANKSPTWRRREGSLVICGSLFSQNAELLFSWGYRRKVARAIYPLTVVRSEATPLRSCLVFFTGTTAFSVFAELIPWGRLVSHGRSLHRLDRNVFRRGARMELRGVEVNMSARGPRLDDAAC
jgi:hypothetical protein